MREPRRSGSNRRASIRWTVPVFVTVMAAYWAAALFVLGVDPLQIYPWGAPAKAAPRATVEAHEDLLPAVIKDPAFDTLLVGGSTTAGYTPEQLRAWIPGVRNAANLSYYSPRTGDEGLVFEWIEKYSHAKKIIVVYHTIYTENLGGIRPGFPDYLLDGRFQNDLQMVTPGNLVRAADVLEGEPLYANSRDEAAEDKGRIQKFERFQTRKSMASLAQDLSIAEPRLRAAAPQSCDAYPAVSRLLAPFVRRMAARGVQVYVMMPAYSLAMPGYWMEIPEIVPRFGANFFERDLAARRCLVEVLDGTPNARVVAFEGERWITGDLGNYRDPVHLHALKPAQFMFGHLDDNNFRLTRGNIDAYVANLRSASLSYKPYNSVVGYGHVS